MTFCDKYLLLLLLVRIGRWSVVCLIFTKDWTLWCQIRASLAVQNIEVEGEALYNFVLFVVDVVGGTAVIVVTLKGGIALVKINQLYQNVVCYQFTNYLAKFKQGIIRLGFIYSCKSIKQFKSTLVLVCFKSRFRQRSDPLALRRTYFVTLCVTEMIQFHNSFDDIFIFGCREVGLFRQNVHFLKNVSLLQNSR